MSSNEGIPEKFSRAVRLEIDSKKDTLYSELLKTLMNDECLTLQQAEEVLEKKIVDSTTEQTRSAHLKELDEAVEIVRLHQQRN